MEMNQYVTEQHQHIQGEFQYLLFGKACLYTDHFSF